MEAPGRVGLAVEVDARTSGRSSMRSARGRARRRRGEAKADGKAWTPWGRGPRYRSFPENRPEDRSGRLSKRGPRPRREASPGDRPRRRAEGAWRGVPSRPRSPRWGDLPIDDQPEIDAVARLDWPDEVPFARREERPHDGNRKRRIVGNPRKHIGGTELVFAADLGRHLSRTARRRGGARGGARRRGAPLRAARARSVYRWYRLGSGAADCERAAAR